MSVKRELIKMLEANRGQAFSGQQLADSLGVTRAAVWKAVQALREQGYAVLAAPNRGYMLSEEDDILSEEGIRLFLSAPFKNCSVKVLPQVDSTNLYARKLFLDEKGDKAMIAANEQTHGRGRLGKSFFSPADTGLYISLVWKEKRSLSSYMPVTMAAAVAVCRVIGKFCEQPPKIKRLRNYKK